MVYYQSSKNPSVGKVPISRCALPEYIAGDRGFLTMLNPSYESGKDSDSLAGRNFKYFWHVTFDIILAALEFQVSYLLGVYP